MKERQTEVFVVNTTSETDFVNNVNSLLKDGWQMHSSSIGFVDSKDYDFCGSYMAIMVKYETL